MYSFTDKFNYQLLLVKLRFCLNWLGGFISLTRFLQNSFLVNKKNHRIQLGSILSYGLFFIAASASFAEPISRIIMPESNNDAEVQLGKALFHSVLLSADNSISCASCHNISEGGDDGLPTSLGINGQLGEINAPTVLNSGLNFVQFWDGRAASLEEQVEGPIHNSVEMGSSWAEVIGKLNKQPEILNQFKDVYAEPISQQRIAEAIAAYEKRLLTLNSPFDRYLQGDEVAITADAKKGYQLFKKLGCVSCHQGKNVGGNMYQKFGIIGNYFEDRGVVRDVDYGIYNLTKREQDKFKFRVPSLRNIDKTSPYFHDGSVATLSEAVRIMARYQLGRPISNSQVESITAFLATLSGELQEGLE